MNGLRWPTFLDTWILFILTGVLQLCHGESHSVCPVDVNGATRRCLRSYHTQVDGLPNDLHYLFMGVDVEIIRRICMALSSSFQCASDIRQACPNSEHRNIELALSEVYSMAEMCTARDFFEVYARNMNCYTQQSPYSEKCYHAFQASTGSIRHLAMSGVQSALVSMCSHLEVLIDCVETNIEIQCGAGGVEAARLAPYLVRPSVTMSESCRNETLYHTPDSPTQRPTKISRETYEEAAIRSSGTKNHNNLSFITLFLVTTLSSALLCSTKHTIFSSGV